MVEKISLVKIVSCDLKTFWYFKKINEEYLVRNSEKFNDCYEVINPDPDELKPIKCTSCKPVHTDIKVVGLFIKKSNCITIE